MAKVQLAVPAFTEDRWTPYVMVLIGIIIGASAPICVRLAQAENVPSLMIAFSRLALSSLVLTPFALKHYPHEIRNLSRQDVTYTAIAGLMLAAHFATLFTAFQNASILIAGVIAGSSPLWVALMEVFVLKVRLSRVVWIGLFLALSGGLVIGLGGGSLSASAEHNLIIGAGLALFSAIFAAVYLIAGRRVRTHMPLLLFLWLVYSSAAVGALIVVIFTGTSLVRYSLEGYFWLVMLTIGAQLIAQSAFNYSLAYLSATFISISGQAVTVVASIGAFLIFSEVPRPLQLVGSVVLIIGVILASIGQSRPVISPDAVLRKSPDN